MKATKTSVQTAVQAYQQWYAYHFLHCEKMEPKALAASAETLRSLKAAALAEIEAKRLGM